MPSAVTTRWTSAVMSTISVRRTVRTTIDCMAFDYGDLGTGKQREAKRKALTQRPLRTAERARGSELWRGGRAFWRRRNSGDREDRQCLAEQGMAGSIVREIADFFRGIEDSRGIPRVARSVFHGGREKLRSCGAISPLDTKVVSPHGPRCPSRSDRRRQFSPAAFW